MFDIINITTIPSLPTAYSITTTVTIKAITATK